MVVYSGAVPRGDAPEVGDDLVLLLQAAGAVLGDRVLEQVRDEVGSDIRFHDGYVFQHLLVGPCTVSELAGHLGISQQAASKHVADLLARRLVTRRRSPSDARAWQVELSARGRQAVEAARRARADASAACGEALGPQDLDRLTAGLRDLCAHLGADDALLDRRLRPEPGR